jgi:hypothetical protein
MTSVSAGAGPPPAPSQADMQSSSHGTLPLPMPAEDDVAGWKAFLLQQCERQNMRQTSAEMDRLMLETRQRGKTFLQLSHKLAQLRPRSNSASSVSHPAAGPGASRSLSEAGSVTVSSLTGSQPSVGPTAAAPQPTPAMNSRAQDGKMAPSGISSASIVTSSQSTWPYSSVTDVTHASAVGAGPSFGRSSNSAVRGSGSEFQAPDGGRSASAASSSGGGQFEATPARPVDYPVPRPPPGIPVNDTEFWFGALKDFIRAHPGLASSPSETSNPAAIIVDDRTLTDFMGQCRERKQPYVALYHRFVKKFGPLPKEAELALQQRQRGSGLGVNDPTDKKNTGLRTEGALTAPPLVRSGNERPPATPQSNKSAFGQANGTKDIPASTLAADPTSTSTPPAAPPPTSRLLSEETRMLQRLRRFCIHHKLKQSDADLERMMNETKESGQPLETLMDRMVKKFGDEPPLVPLQQPPTESGQPPRPINSGAASAKPSDEQSQLQQLQAFLGHHGLDNSEVVCEMLLSRTKEKGKPFEYLMTKLKEKYGDGPVQVAVPSPPPSTGSGLDQPPPLPLQDAAKRSLSSSYGEAVPSYSRREIAFKRLKNFFQSHRWEIVPSLLDEMLDEAVRLHGDPTYETLFRRLVDLYGSEPPLEPDYMRQLQAYRQLDLRLKQERSPSRLAVGYRGDLEDNLGPEKGDTPYKLMQHRTYDTISEMEALRSKVKSKVQRYCRHYKLPKSERDIERLIDDFEKPGWDAMFEKLERKFGPVPWPQYEHTLLLREIGGTQQSPIARDRLKRGLHIDSPSAGFPTGGGALGLATAEKTRLLQRFNETFRIGWSQKEIDRMVDTMGAEEGKANGPTFADLISALEAKYGPLPPTNYEPHTGFSPDSPRRPNQVIQSSDLEAERALVRLGLVPEYSKSLATLATPVKVEDERIFWRDRIKNYLDHYVPEESFSLADVEQLMGQYSKSRSLAGQTNLTDHDLWADFWRHLLDKYGPEPAVPQSTVAGNSSLDDPTMVGSLRRYWYCKFKDYCDYYDIKKTPAELERMLDTYRERGWARMYDQLVELHGPPPPVPPATLATGLKSRKLQSTTSGGAVPSGSGLTKEQWRHRLEQFCKRKFPQRSADEVAHVVNLFMTLGSSAPSEKRNRSSSQNSFGRGMGPDSEEDQDEDAARLEALFEGLSALAGPGGEGTSRSADGASPLSPARAAVKASKIVLNFTGLDAGLYNLAQEIPKRRFDSALVADLVLTLGFPDSTSVRVSDIRSVAKEAVVEFEVMRDLLTPATIDVLVTTVSNGSYRTFNTKASYEEDLAGAPGYLRPTSAAVIEMRQTPNFPLSASQVMQNPLEPTRSSNQSSKVVAAQGVHSTGVSRRTALGSNFSEDFQNEEGAPNYGSSTGTGELSVAPKANPLATNGFLTAAWATPTRLPEADFSREAAGTYTPSMRGHASNLTPTPSMQRDRSADVEPRDMYGFNYVGGSTPRYTSPSSGRAYAERKRSLSVTPHWPN